MVFVSAEGGYTVKMDFDGKKYWSGHGGHGFLLAPPERDPLPTGRKLLLDPLNRGDFL